MVTNVITNGLMDGPFTKLMKRFYIDCSSRSLPYDLFYPIQLYDYIDLVYSQFNADYFINDIKIKFPKHELNSHDSRCICAFSGGKDSLANILILKQLGYEPILFFVKGINYKFPNEYDIAKDLAKRLDLTFIEYKLIVQGQCEYPENPIKNQLILSIMLDYGLKLGITHYSFGTYVDAFIDEVSSEYMLSDATSMFDVFIDFVNTIYPEVDMPMFLNDCCEAYKTIIDYDSNLIQYTNSCMSPLRYKSGYIKRAIKKYNIELLPNRCPSCYKCCTEAIILNDFGITHYPESFISHCKDVVIKFYSSYKSEEYIDAMRTDDYEWTISKYLGD